MPERPIKILEPADPDKREWLLNATRRRAENMLGLYADLKEDLEEALPYLRGMKTEDDLFRSANPDFDEDGYRKFMREIALKKTKKLRESFLKSIDSSDSSDPNVIYKKRYEMNNAWHADTSDFFVAYDQLKRDLQKNIPKLESREFTELKGQCERILKHLKVLPDSILRRPRSEVIDLFERLLDDEK